MVRAWLEAFAHAKERHFEQMLLINLQKQTNKKLTYMIDTYIYFRTE